jgi:DNA-directed RNA polymerase specialized sigma24 family protein
LEPTSSALGIFEPVTITRSVCGRAVPSVVTNVAADEGKFCEKALAQVRQTRLPVAATSYYYEPAQGDASVVRLQMIPSQNRRARACKFPGFRIEKKAEMSAALSLPTRDSLFASTRWTVVYQAADSKISSEHALSALSELCQIYWRPVYLFLRRHGIPQHDAEDLTQGFFTDLIQNRVYARADRMKGRFRSFLLGTLKHFLADARDRDRAQKRGGGSVPLQLDEAAISEAETHAARCQTWSADGVFEREWAASLLRQTLERLAQEYAIAGKAALFEALKVHLAAGAAAAIPYEEMARRLGRAAATLRSDVARLRARYRAILREEVSGTLVDPRDVDEELRHLRQTMAA